MRQLLTSVCFAPLALKHMFNTRESLGTRWCPFSAQRCEMAPIAFKIKVFQRGASHLPACTPYLFYASLYHNILIHRPKLIRVHSYPQALVLVVPLASCVFRVSVWYVPSPEICSTTPSRGSHLVYLITRSLGYPNLIHPGLFLQHISPFNTLHNWSPPICDLTSVHQSLSKQSPQGPVSWVSVASPGTHVAIEEHLLNEWLYRWMSH